MNPSPLIPHLSNKEKSSDFQARFSKWISIDLLIDGAEMKGLLEEMAPLFLLTMQDLSTKTPFILEVDHFLKVYGEYIDALKNKKVPEAKDFKKLFYLFLGSSLKDIFTRSISEEKKALVFNTPLIEVKPICLTLSNVDHSIRSMPLHPNGILWGLRFAFPQMLQKGGSLDIESIDLQSHPNGLLFKKFRTWVRKNTKATPFMIHSKKVNLPIRLGKHCFSWINNHPQFKEDLKIEVNHQ